MFETCQRLICQQCTIDTHNGHKYNLISEAFKRGKKCLKTMLVPAERELEKTDGLMDEYCKRRDEILAQKAQIEGEIDNVVHQLEEAVAAKKAELHSELEKQTHIKLTALNVDKGMLHTLETSLSSDITHAKSLAKNASEEELLLAKESIQQMLKRSCADTERSNLQPREAANMILRTNTEPALLSLQALATVTTYQECPGKCFASGNGVSQATVGKKSKVEVHVVDHDGKPCKEAYASEIEYQIIPRICGREGEKLTGCARKRIDGRYELSYTPAIKGIHELSISMHKQHIRGSPSKVVVKSCLGPENLITRLPCEHKPCGVALTQTGELLAISTHSSSITVMRQNGEKVEEFGVGKYADAAVGDDGTMYVTILEANEIQKFSPEGDFLSVVGRRGRGKLMFDYPTGIAFNTHNSRLYIANSRNHEIQVLNTDFTFYKSFGEKGSEKRQFEHPWNVCCDSSGKVFVADSGNDRIQVFTSEGKFIRMFGESGGGAGQLKRPRGIAIDEDNLVYVSDCKNRRISVFKAGGQFVRCLGEGGELGSPRGVAVDSNTGVVCVCDYDNSSILIY